LAVNLASETSTYRPSQPSKFARLTFDTNGQVGSLLFPIINEILVVPAIQVMGGQAGSPPRTNIIDFDVTRFKLRIRTRKTLAVLENLKNAASLEQLAEAAADLVSASLYNEKPSVDPLDRADDFLGVARNLLKTGNFPLASLALANVDLALDSFMKTPSMADHLGVAQGMREQVKQMMGQLRQSSS
jgi:hypothetical protein